MIPMDEQDFDFFNLNKHKLDDEWISQPKLYFKHASLLADAKREAAQLKAELEVVEGELKMDIANHPADYGIEKPTVDAIKACVPTCKRHKNAVQALIDANHKIETLGAVVSALDHRKRALSDLVQLQLSNYWSEPRLPNGEERERLDRASKSSAFDRRERR